MASVESRLARMAAAAPRQEPESAPERGARPPYEPPRITKKRSLSRATLFTFEGPDASGVTANG